MVTKTQKIIYYNYRGTTPSIFNGKDGGGFQMLNFIFGLVVGANLSLFLYAIILAGKDSRDGGNDDN
mgnify:CR=1 FL=1